jgi:hypothetical protein
MSEQLSWWARRSGSQLSVGRGIALLALVAAIFTLGIYSEAFLNAVDQGWQHLLTLLGRPHPVAEATVSALVTKRSLVSVGTYSLLYTGLSLLLLALALSSWPRFRLALQLYAGIFVVCAVLVGLGRVADVTWAYQLARRLIDFIVSPLPVIILIPLLRWQNVQPAQP